MSIWEMYQIKQHYPKLKENKIFGIQKKHDIFSYWWWNEWSANTLSTEK